MVSFVTLIVTPKNFKSNESKNSGSDAEREKFLKSYSSAKSLGTKVALMMPK
jgi:hypothetical protein